MKLCPFFEQDQVWRVRLKSQPQHCFAMCFECDSVWADGPAISDAAGTTFDQYVRALGRKPDWMDLERLEQVTEDAPSP